MRNSFTLSFTGVIHSFIILLGRRKLKAYLLSNLREQLYFIDARIFKIYHNKKRCVVQKPREEVIQETRITGRRILRESCAMKVRKEEVRRLNAGFRLRWHLLTRRNSKLCASSKRSDRHRTAPTKIVGNSYSGACSGLWTFVGSTHTHVLLARERGPQRSIHEPDSESVYFLYRLFSRGV